MPTSANADDPTDLPGDENTVPDKTNPNGRPKAPAYKLVSLEVMNDFLTINFKSPQGNAEIEILNLETGIKEQYAFDTALPFTCYIGFSSIGYQIEIITDSGMTISYTL